MPEQAKRNLHAVAVGHVMPRHAPFYFGLVFGVVGLVLALLVVPKYAISLGANCLFAGYLALTFLKLPLLTASYLHEHAREEDTPGKGILLVVSVVIAASVVSLFLALNQDGGTELGEIIASIASVILGWFTVQVMGGAALCLRILPGAGSSSQHQGGGRARLPWRRRPRRCGLSVFLVHGRHVSCHLGHQSLI